MIRSNRTREETPIIRHSNSNRTIDTQAVSTLSACFAKRKFISPWSCVYVLAIRPQEPRDDQGMVVELLGDIYPTPTLNCALLQDYGDRDDRDPNKNRLEYSVCCNPSGRRHREGRTTPAKHHRAVTIG
jgi:hypothetical protein